MNKEKLPIIVGITGHRRLLADTVLPLKTAVKEQLQAVVLKCPESPVKVLCCLAEGADQLCAEVACELNIGLIAVLPMQLEEYRKDFSGDALSKFDKLLAKAEKVVAAPDTEKKAPLPGNNGDPERSDVYDAALRDYSYRQAGIYIASHSHCLLSLWDGSDPKGNGCGTAEVTDMVLNHSYQDSERCVVTDDGYVIHVLTPRNEGVGAGTVSYLGNAEAFDKNISKLNELNRDGGDPDSLSVKNGKKYHGALMWIAALGTILTMAFLLYDEVMLRWMLLVLGFGFISMTFVFKIADRMRCHEKYIEYRALAEGLRVQEHLRRIGSDLEVFKYLDWSRRSDTEWICKALQAAAVIGPEGSSENVKTDWVLDQKAYHERAAEKTIHQKRRNKIILTSALALTLTVYAFAMVFEYGLVYTIDGNAELIRTVIKVAAGTASAASLFAANYYGKLSLKHVYEDHVRMAEYFKSVAEYIDRFGVSEKLLKEMVNEELSENSNWCSYEKDNEIDLSV